MSILTATGSILATAISILMALMLFVENSSPQPISLETCELVESCIDEALTLAASPGKLIVLNDSIIQIDRELQDWSEKLYLSRKN